MPPRALPSFTLVVSSRRDSFSPPDYCQPTSVENYGPYYRDSGRDLMKTLDLRGRENTENDQSFLLPDILEDEELDLVDTKSIRSESESTRCGYTSRKGKERGEVQAGGKLKRLWLWRSFFSLLHKFRGPKGHSVQNAKLDPDCDLND